MKKLLNRWPNLDIHAILIFMFLISLWHLSRNASMDNIIYHVTVTVWVINWYISAMEARRAQEMAKMWQEYADMLLRFIYEKGDEHETE